MIGITIGLVNGLIVTKLKVNPFIATLGMSLIIKGIINATFSNYTGSVPAGFRIFWIWNAWANSGFDIDFVAGCLDWMVHSG